MLTDREWYSDLDLCFYGEIPWNVLSHLQENLEENNLPFKVDLVAWNWMSQGFQDLIRKDLTPILKHNKSFCVVLIVIKQLVIIKSVMEPKDYSHLRILLKQQGERIIPLYF